jgi:hypothetical protein
MEIYGMGTDRGDRYVGITIIFHNNNNNNNNYNNNNNNKLKADIRHQ